MGILSGGGSVGRWIPAALRCPFFLVNHCASWDSCVPLVRSKAASSIIGMRVSHWVGVGVWTEWSGIAFSERIASYIFLARGIVDLVGPGQADIFCI
jgi:hypothetical protein